MKPAQTMQRKNIVLFVLVPVCLNLLLIGLYFSGIERAQQIIAPSVQSLNFRSWREFGLVEQLQNVFLLCIIIIFIINIHRRELLTEKALFLAGALVMLFLFLEEIDYGIHFYEFYIGHDADIADKSRNWHNKVVAGKTNVIYLKHIVNLVMVFWFVHIPLLSAKHSFGCLHKLIPSPWFLAGFTISLVFASLAHYLQDMRLDVINGNDGNLLGNISEFRETSNYYLYCLYAIQLAHTHQIFKPQVQFCRPIAKYLVDRQDKASSKS